MSSQIILVPLHRGERNVDKVGLGFNFYGRDTGPALWMLIC